MDFPKLIALSLLQSLRTDVCMHAGDNDDGDEKGDADGSMEIMGFNKVGLSVEEE